ncbi:MAG TPA: TIM barrel protein [Euzebyales bacterium]|nr:TIM barrel protein [Euzebyales bacterium]
MSGPGPARTSSRFDLAVCAEMVFVDLPMSERIRRIVDLGFQVEIWNHGDHDVDALAATGAAFSSMTGYVTGSLVDAAGGDAYVRTAAPCIAVAQRLGCPRLNLHGTGLDGRGLPVVPVTQVTGPMRLSALRTLERLAGLGERHGVTFCLENLNTALDHPGVPFARAEDTLALVEAVGHPHLRMNLDLYHAQIGGGDFRAPGSTGHAPDRLRATEHLIELVRRADPLIGEIQVADVPGRCEPGTGEIDYAAVCAALVAMGYRGTVGLEAWASGDPRVALERFRATFTPTIVEAGEHAGGSEPG